MNQPKDFMKATEVESIVQALLMSEIESAYLERDQMQSTSLQDEYLQHFLRNEPVIGIEYEAQLQKTLLPQITAAEISKYAVKLQTSCSCVMKTIEPRASATVGDLKNVVSMINDLEEKRIISPWDDEQIPEEIVNTKPNPGCSFCFYFSGQSCMNFRFFTLWLLLVQERSSLPSISRIIHVRNLQLFLHLPIQVRGEDEIQDNDGSFKFELY